MSLSQKQFSEFKKVCEEFNQVEEIIEEELVHEICDELVEELVTEGYSEEDAIVIVEDAANDYIDEAKVTFGKDTTPLRKSGAPVGARRRFAMRKAGAAVKAAGSAAKGAVSKAKVKQQVPLLMLLLLMILPKKQVKLRKQSLMPLLKLQKQQQEALKE